MHICCRKKDARSECAVVIAVAVGLSLTVHMPRGLGSPNKSMTTPNESPAAARPPTSPAESQVPEAILRPILNEAAKVANVSPQQLVIVRAEPVIWNDGSLGCPEPGMEYTQSLVNG